MAPFKSRAKNKWVGQTGAVFVAELGFVSAQQRDWRQQRADLGIGKQRFPGFGRQINGGQKTDRPFLGINQVFAFMVCNAENRLPRTRLSRPLPSDRLQVAQHQQGHALALLAAGEGIVVGLATVVEVLAIAAPDHWHPG